MTEDVESLRRKLADAEAVLEAIRNEEVDALVGSDKIFLLKELQETKKELLDTERRLRLVMESAKVATWEIDLNTGSLTSCAKLGLMFRLPDLACPQSREEYLSLFSKEDQQRIQVADEHAIRSGEQYEMDYRIRLPDGETRWLRNLVVPVADNRGLFVRLVGIITDITKHVHDEEEIILKNEKLEEALAERDRFFSIIAHDLRSPFMGFLVFIKMLTERVDSLNVQQIQRLSHDMQESAQNLYRLLENLLEWALAQRGEIAFEPVRCDLADTVGRNIELIKMPALQKAVEFHSDIPAGLEVLADKSMLNTILRNLFTNAIKFSNSGTVRVRAVRDDSFVTISVKDEGIGMDQEALSSLLRLDKMRSRKGTGGEKGTGLGLLLCKELIDKQGGKLWANSKAGKGTTIYFTLPAYDDDPVADAVAHNPDKNNAMLQI
ncbi:PAS domain-containing sensor histidine kinase [Desulfonatronum parangueonense]